MYEPGWRVHRRGDYVWGSFVRAPRMDGWINAVNPGDRDDGIGRFGFGLTRVDDAVGAAARGHLDWSALDVDARAEAVRRLGERLEEQAEDLAFLIARETGKPLWEAHEEVYAARRACRLLSTDGKAVVRERVLQEGAAWSVPRPHGVVAVITPWTLPLLLPVLYVGAALVAGNCVVFKPSKFAPSCGQALAEAFDRLRLPRGAFNLVQGPGSLVGDRLASHPGIDALVLAGRSETADRVRRANAPRPSLPMLLQTGGKATALVLHDANPALAAHEVAIGAFVTAGQRHDATARVFIDRRAAGAFTEALVARTQALRVGYGFDDVFMGPMISDSHRRLFRAGLDAAVDRGAETLLEGGAHDHPHRRGFYVRPDIRRYPDAPRPDEIPVGPALRLFEVDDVEHAIRRANALWYRGAVSVFTERVEFGAQLAGRLSAGAVHVNRATIGASLRLPSVARGRASNGWPGMIEAVRFLAAPQAVIVDRRAYDTTRTVPGTGSLPEAPPAREGEPGAGRGTLPPPPVPDER